MPSSTAQPHLASFSQQTGILVEIRDEAHYGLVQLDKRDGNWTVGQRKPAFQAIKHLATKP